MEKDRSISPIESIEKTLRVKPIGSIRLFKRPEYMPQKKKNNYFRDKKEEAEELGQEQGKIVNHATHSGKIGVSIDYKV